MYIIPKVLIALYLLAMVYFLYDTSRSDYNKRGDRRGHTRKDC
jgi:hypothetical protein